MSRLDTVRGAYKVAMRMNYGLGEEETADRELVDVSESELQLQPASGSSCQAPPYPNHEVISGPENRNPSLFSSLTSTVPKTLVK